MKKSILFLSLITAMNTVHADSFNDSDVITLHMGSRHLNTEEVFDESNPGVGYRHGSGRVFLAAGYYENSLSRGTVYASLGRTLVQLGPVSLSLMSGVATGYYIPVVPFVLPELSVRYGDAYIMASYIPRVSYKDDGMPAAVTLSTGIKF